MTKLKFKLSKPHKRILLREGCLDSFETNVKRRIERLGYGYHRPEGCTPWVNQDGIKAIELYLITVNTERSFAMKLQKAFVWCETPQGFVYWFDLFNRYYREPRLKVVKTFDRLITSC